MINDLDFEEYRSDVLGLLLTHNKISPRDYRRSLENSYSRKKQPIVNEHHEQNFYAPIESVAGNVEGNYIYTPQNNEN